MRNYGANRSEKKKRMKWDSLRDLQDITKWINCTHYGSARNKGEKGAGSLFEEIVTENLPNLRKEMDIKLNEYQKR